MFTIDWILVGTVVGTLAPVAALVWSVHHARKSSRPDVTIVGAYAVGTLPYQGDDGLPGAYSLTVQATEPITVKTAGLGRKPKKRAAVKVPDAAARRGNQPLFVRPLSPESSVVPPQPLPQSAEAAETLYVSFTEDDARDAGAEPREHPYGWVELSSGHRYFTGSVEWLPPGPSLRQREVEQMQRDAKEIQRRMQDALRRATNPERGG